MSTDPNENNAQPGPTPSGLPPAPNPTPEPCAEELPNKPLFSEEEEA